MVPLLISPMRKIRASVEVLIVAALISGMLSSLRLKILFKNWQYHIGKMYQPSLYLPLTR